MMLKVIAVGKLKDKAFSARCEEYAKWLTRYGKFELTELSDGPAEKTNAALAAALEHEKAFRVVMSEEGKLFPTEELAAKLGGIDRKIVFAIGGEDGLNDAVKRKADLLLSLSPLTFTHELARLFLLEQLYRCSNFLAGGSYHRS